MVILVCSYHSNMTFFYFRRIILVFFDGERLCVQLTKGKNYKEILNIAKESEYFEYLQDVNIFCLPPTKKIFSPRVNLTFRTIDEE